MEIPAIGTDFGKTWFHLVAADANGSVVARNRCSSTQLLRYTANVRVRVIGMEACSGSHFSGADACLAE
jgi:transposase